MAANETPAVFDSNTDSSNAEFTPVDAGSDVTITYADDGSSSMMGSVPEEVRGSAPSAEDESGFVSSLRRGVSFFKSFVPSDVNQRFDNFRAEQSNSMKPWKTFLGLPDFAGSYGFINPKFIPSRCMSNFKSYLWNYVALVGITFAIISLFNFPFFLVALALIGVWLYTFFWKPSPSVVLGYNLPLKFVTIGLAIVSIAVCWFVLGNDFWIAVLCDLVVCALHALVRKSESETVDFH